MCLLCETIFKGSKIIRLLVSFHLKLSWPNSSFLPTPIKLSLTHRGGCMRVCSSVGLTVASKPGGGKENLFYNLPTQLCNYNMSQRVHALLRPSAKCSLMWGLACKENRGNCNWMLSQTHKCGLLILILLGLFLKPLLAVTLQHVSHTDALTHTQTHAEWFIWKCVFLVTETGREREIKRDGKECLSSSKR